MEEIKSTHYASDTEINFLEVTAIKNGSSWEYSETGPWFSKRPIGSIYNNLIAKATSLKNNGKLNELRTILCNAACAVELYVNGVITKEMIDSIEEKVSGAGGGMHALVCIPKQDFVLVTEALKQVSIVIVDCSSYNGFCFIDINNKDM